MSSFIYICNNFTGNKVHSETIYNLSKKYNNINHYIFVACNNKNLINKNIIESDNIFIEYIYIHKIFRFFPVIKSLILFCLIFLRGRKKCIKWNKAKILAYTFWSDGIIALYFNLFFNTSFSVFVRVTDLSIFFKYAFYLKPLLYLISRKSKFIFFPSLVLKKYYSNYRIFKKDIVKRVFLPNSINQFWLDNVFYFNNLAKKNKKILFVGSFDKNKNLPAVLNSCMNLYSYRQDFTLEFIGGSVTSFKELCKINDIPEWVLVTEKLSDKQELLTKYRESNILLVPSFLETFGMVYLEAISQGCFVIHSKDQGIDYLFDNGFSYSINPFNIQEISNLLNHLLDKNFQLDSSSLKNELNLFSSSEIIDLYSCFFD